MKYQLITSDIMNWLNLASRYGYRQNYYHAMLLDPPYHLTSITKRFGKSNMDNKDTPNRSPHYKRLSKGFMGQAWDGGDLAFNPELWLALKERLLPGAFCFAFAGSRGWHRMAMAIEDAGFIMHPTIFLWAYGSGFPKATRIDTQIDNAAGAERGIVREKKQSQGPESMFRRKAQSTQGYRPEGKEFGQLAKDTFSITTPATPEAAQWKGHRYGLQAIKPAVEPILCFQKPYEGRPVDNIVKTGAGALNIEKGRVKQTSQDPPLDVPSFLSSFFPELLDADDIENHILSSVQDALLNISFALRSYSNDDIDLLHNAYDQDDNLPSGVECAILLAYLFPNGVWCGLDVTSIEDFQSDCQLCRHLYDELFHGVQEAAQGTSLLLADVLEHIYRLLSEPSHNQQCLDNTHYPIQTFASAFINLLYNYIISYSKHPHNSGRWPSNLILSHHPDCRNAGAKRIKGSQGTSGGSSDGKGIYGKAFPRGDKRAIGFGTETVTDWQCVDQCPIRLLDEQANITNPNLHSSGQKTIQRHSKSTFQDKPGISQGYGNEDAGPSRFFYQSHFAYEIAEQIAAADPVRYVAKAGNTERNAGLDELPNQTRHRVNSGGLENEPRWSPVETKNFHPTLKPIALTKYLASLLLPPEAYEPRRILVPFSGSSSEMIGALLAGWDEVTGIEMTKRYIPIAKSRLEWWTSYLKWGQDDIDTILKTASQNDDRQLSFIEEL